MRLFRRNALGVYAVYAAATVSGLVVTPIVLHTLGTETFGIWSFIGAITAYLAVLDLGVAPSVIRATAEARGRKTPDEVAVIASVALTVYGVIGAATLGAGLVLAWFVPRLVDASESQWRDARLCALLVVLSLVVRFPLGLFNSLLAGHQRFDVQNTANFVSTIAYAGAVALLVPRGGGLVLLGALTLAATLVRLALPLAWLKREFPGLRLRFRHVTRRGVRDLVRISGGNFLGHAASKVFLSADVVVVGVVLGAAEAGVYAIASRLFAIAFGVASATTPFLLPAFAESEGAGEPRRQRELLLLALRGGAAVALLIALPLLVLRDEVLVAWIGDGYGRSAEVLFILGLVALVHQPVSIVTQYLVAVKRQRRVAEVLVPTAAANILLSVLGAHFFGIEAVAWATLVTDLAALAAITAVLGSTASVGFRLVGRAILRPVLPAAAGAAVVLVGSGELVDPDSLARLAPVGAIWLAAGAALVWRYGFSAQERAVIRRVR